MRPNNLWERWMVVWRRLSHPLQIFILTFTDIALIGIGLCIFALFHHVLPRTEQAMGVVSSRGGTTAVSTANNNMETTDLDEDTDTAEEEFGIGEADGTDMTGSIDLSGTNIAPAETAIPGTVPVYTETNPGTIPAVEASAVPTVAPATDQVGYFGTKFADKFTSGEIIDTVDSNGVAIYKSPNICMTGTKYTENKLVYYVVDIYVKDISCIRTALANDKYGRGQKGKVAEIATAHDAIAAVNGDYYGARSEGSVIRNGMLYRDVPFKDMCVLYWDGTMETFSDTETTAVEQIEKGAYQAWSFGPMLLDKNGDTMTKFDSSVTGNNPRTAFGYFEPGHYCFVVVDGRSSASSGLKMKDLSSLMKSLGCVRAYNLDGGQTSQLVWKGEIINNPYKGGRQCSDIVMVGEPTTFESPLP